MRLVPATLRGRLMVTLLIGLMVAQALGAIILLRDRAEALSEARGISAVQRIAGMVQVLDRLDSAARREMIQVFQGERLEVSLDVPAPELADEPSFRESALARALRGQIAGDPPVVVNLMRPWGEPLPADYHRPGGLRFKGASGSVLIVVTTRLTDGSWMRIAQRLGSESGAWPRRLLLVLLVLAGVVVVLVVVGVRWLTRPLDVLASAADDLGRNIHRPPLPETGPAEVRRAASAFNAMQRRLLAYLHERERTVAAISHDLRTPLTRLHLRAELIEDESLRGKIDRDLEEMERLTATALDYVRGAGGEEQVESVDLVALLESLQSDYAEAGCPVSVQGSAETPVPGRPLALRRLFRNLIDNALKYGQRADIRVQTQSADLLQIIVADAGPGISEDVLEEVFEPFYRVEPSRSRSTGGIGLGLAVARDIARLHGGELTLRNSPGGSGLEAVVILPGRIPGHRIDTPNYGRRIIE